MGEFIIAVLIVSVLWIAWDVLKLVLGESAREDAAAAVAKEPGREQMLKYSQSFFKLSETFRRMPEKKECLSQQDIEDMFRMVKGKVCQNCPQCALCWQENYYKTYRRIYSLLNSIEEEGEQLNTGRQEAFGEFCVTPREFLNELDMAFRQAKINLTWSNRLLENRAAVGEQLYETGLTLQHVADTIYDVEQLERSVLQELRLKLKFRGVFVKEVWISENDPERPEIFMNARTKKGRCVPTKEVAEVLSEACGRPIVPGKDSRMIVNKEYATLMFVTEPEYCLLNGVARVTKDGELVSGDNFAFLSKENGQAVMSLADGMGSGFGACQESELVIELLEQFLDAGFCKETAVKMIHSAMMMQNSGQIFSTVDLCTVDLYSGECELLKVGASTTFVKRQDWVESVTSTSLPLGMLQNIDYECTKKKLNSGDFIIMISDGVLDALPGRNSQDMMKELILQIKTSNARDMARKLLEQVLSYQQSRASDDMTILVGGLWKK